MPVIRKLYYKLTFHPSNTIDRTKYYDSSLGIIQEINVKSPEIKYIASPVIIRRRNRREIKQAALLVKKPNVN